MLCALTVRTLKPGTFEDFRRAFMGHANPDSAPDGWVRFNMIRGLEHPDEVVCFGFFAGTLEELRSAGRDGYDQEQQGHRAVRPGRRHGRDLRGRRGLLADALGRVARAGGSAVSLTRRSALRRGVTSPRCG